ncbi:MAG TPA: hypothetical protein VGH28_21085 [Polyangiaceae bacterium]|jgi:hypothetical protein
MNRKIILLVMLVAAAGCKKKLTADAIENSSAAIVQKGDRGTSAWIVAPDGSVNASLKDSDGKPIAGTVTGQVTFENPDGAPQSVPVQYDPKTGVVTATGPKLAADITPVKYALTVDGQPWNGSLEVPRTGTQGLVDDAKIEAPADLPATGPNGGVVQMVGPDRVEIVANKSNGEVRAYVLDPQNHVIDPGDRKITVSIGGEDPEVVVLAPAPAGQFVVGHLRTRVDPVNVTVAVNEGGATHACIVGWRWHPGAVVVVGPAAPRVHLLVDAWPGEVVEVHGKHHEVIVGAPAVVVGAPGVVVGAPGVFIGGPGFHVGGGHHGRH